MQLKRIGLTTLAGLAIAACAPSSEDQATVSPAAQDVDRDPASDAAPARPAESAAAPEPGTLAWAINGDWRSAEQRRRDVFRNPAETLDFLGVSPDATIVEMWPGSGWYTQILAPYLAAGGGQLIAAGWDGDAYEGERAERIAERNEAFREAFSDEALYGNIAFSAFSGQSGELAAPGRADLVLTFRNLHNWMSGGYADKFYADAFEALRPGGILGIVEHRLPSTLEQDPTASSGYVHEDFVKAAAERAGFEFVASSEINANPADTADHPFGVWTLPPVLRTQDRQGRTPEGFDPAKYAAIGESDRMTLKFRKPE